MASASLLCGPCGFNNINKTAHKWCTNCEEGYCKDCEKMHKSTKILRDHKLINIEGHENRVKIPFIEKCEEHNQTLDSYCKSHDKVLCLWCVLSQHKSCENIIPLEKAAKNAKLSTILTDIENTVSVVLKNIESIIQNITSNSLDIQENKIKEEIEELRNNINDRLDVIEQNVMLELESKIAKYRSKQHAVLENVKENQTKVKRLKQQVTEMRNLASDSQLFLASRQINKDANEFLTQR